MTDLVRALAIIANDLEHRQYRAVGVIRRAARALAEGVSAPEPGPGHCAGCGDELPPVGAKGGRPRKFCAACRPSPPQKPPRNRTLAP